MRARQGEATFGALRNLYSGVLSYERPEGTRSCRNQNCGRSPPLTRPPNGDWSVLENVRHLLFSHGTLLREAGLESSPRTNARPGSPEYKLGATRESSIEEVLELWRSEQGRVRSLGGRDTELVRWALAVILRHIRNHITVIERILRAQDRAGRAARGRRRE
jgi:hypothetical protein